MSAARSMQMAKMSILDLPVTSLPAETLQRFWDKVATTDDLDACWLWTGALNTPGEINWSKTRRGTFLLSSNPVIVVYAHRFALALWLGCSMSDLRGYEACHTNGCTSPICCNGRHLYKGTREDNDNDRYPWRRQRARLDGL